MEKEEQEEVRGVRGEGRKDKNIEEGHGKREKEI